MKVGIVQVPSPAGAGVVNFTDAQFSGDVVGGIFLADNATANDTTTATARFGIGATDGTNNISLGFSVVDATAGAGSQGIISSTKSIISYAPGSGVVAPTGALSSVLSNGLAMNLTSASTGRLMSCMLLGGSDIGMKVGSAQFAAATTSQVVTHGLGHAPDIIILLVGEGATGTDTAISSMDVGLWERQNGTAAAYSLFMVNNANPTSFTGYVSNVDSGQLLGNGVTNGNVTITSAGNTTFTITFSAGAGTNVMVGWIAVCGNGIQMASKCFASTIPTSNGTSNIVTGLTSPAQAVLVLPTRMTSVATVVTSDAAGSYGAGFACNRLGVSQYGGAFATSQYNVATSQAKSVASAQYQFASLTDAGAYSANGNISSWGTTLVGNYPTTNGSSLYQAGMAFGMPPASQPGFPYRLQRRTFLPVYIPKY